MRPFSVPRSAVLPRRGDLVTVSKPVAARAGARSTCATTFAGDHARNGAVEDAYATNSTQRAYVPGFTFETQAD
jgi:hypothetical protein